MPPEDVIAVLEGLRERFTQSQAIHQATVVQAQALLDVNMATVLEYQTVIDGLNAAIAQIETPAG